MRPALCDLVTTLTTGDTIRMTRLDRETARGTGMTRLQSRCRIREYISSDSHLTKPAHDPIRRESLGNSLPAIGREGKADVALTRIEISPCHETQGSRRFYSLRKGRIAKENQFSRRISAPTFPRDLSTGVQEPVAGVSRGCGRPRQDKWHHPGY